MPRRTLWLGGSLPRDRARERKASLREPILKRAVLLLLKPYKAAVPELLYQHQHGAGIEIDVLANG